MWGGLTTADELRDIAEVEEKFSVPTVHITGGQRIDLLGIDKEDLPAVWNDLNKAGMVREKAVDTKTMVERLAGLAALGAEPSLHK